VSIPRESLFHQPASIDGTEFGVAPGRASNPSRALDPEMRRVQVVYAKRLHHEGRSGVLGTVGPAQDVAAVSCVSSHSSPGMTNW
jgi:hypothetical protein